MAQSRCCLQCRRLVHADLDSVHLGMGQRAGASRLVILYLGRSMMLVAALLGFDHALASEDLSTFIRLLCV